MGLCYVLTFFLLRQGQQREGEAASGPSSAPKALTLAVAPLEVGLSMIHGCTQKSKIYVHVLRKICQAQVKGLQNIC